VIRLARAQELPALVELERRASARFADVAGLAHWVDDITELSDLEPAVAREMVWVAEVDGERAGWCYASPVDDSLFVEEVDVVPEYGRRGIGRALLDTVAAAAGERGLAAVTLTTDAHVPWNGPWYEKLGFAVVPPAQRGPDLAAKLADEARRGFDLTRRVTMRRPLLRRSGE
jgi:GNAT superfamily N-acetyltransferase